MPISIGPNTNRRAWGRPVATALLVVAALGVLRAGSGLRRFTDFEAGQLHPDSTIYIREVDNNELATQLTIHGKEARYTLEYGPSIKEDLRIITNNPRVVQAEIRGRTLLLRGLEAGRAGLRIESLSGKVRHIGVKVLTAGGKPDELPPYLPIGAASEDTADDVNFWQGFAEAQPRFVDIRYIYLNGGPFNGWRSWGAPDGSRIVNAIRNSRKLGMMPWFVWYNLPASREGPDTARRHLQDPEYMRAYFLDLKLALELIAREYPDAGVGMILEPDFLGYMAQQGRRPTLTRAATRAAYDAGVLSRDSDGHFPDTVSGFVSAVNLIIRKYNSQIRYGWHVNLWASPAGGWQTPVRPKGVIHTTEYSGWANGRMQLTREAAGIARYYRDAGVLSYGAGFVALDKFGLDAAGAEEIAASDPGSSTWFWNSDLWSNYLAFVGTLHRGLGLPVVLWQLPMGHINGSRTLEGSGRRIPDLGNVVGAYEDSAATYFFGDTFVASGPRLNWFSANQARDPGVVVNNSTVTWRSHMKDARDAGVLALLFGAGTTSSTTGTGSSPGDRYWWLTKMAAYQQSGEL